MPTEGTFDATAVTFVDGEAESLDKMFEIGSSYKAGEKKINGETYIFNTNGEMKSGLIDTDNGRLYYGESSDGAKKDGAQTIEDDCEVAYKFYFSTGEKDGYAQYAAVTGAKAGKLYNDGILVTSGDAKYAVKDVVIDGETYYFIVNKSGAIQTAKNKEYKDGDDVVENTANVVWTDKTGIYKGSYTK